MTDKHVPGRVWVRPSPRPAPVAEEGLPFHQTFVVAVAAAIILSSATIAIAVSTPAVVFMALAWMMSALIAVGVAFGWADRLF